VLLKHAEDDLRIFRTHSKSSGAFTTF